MDDMKETLYADIAAETLLAQVEEERNMHIIMLNKVIYHRVGPNAVPIAYIYCVTKNGFDWRKRTSHIWEMCVHHKSRSPHWVVMTYIKDFTQWNWVSI